jgi:small nuclear ribonucleoprotein (snRNP)-like protein
VVLLLPRKSNRSDFSTTYTSIIKRIITRHSPLYSILIQVALLAMARKSKLHTFVSHRVKLVLRDGAALTGVVLAFDKDMNVVLNDAKDELGEKTRVLGLVVIRGRNVQSISLDPVSKIISGNKSRLPASEVLKKI